MGTNYFLHLDHCTHCDKAEHKMHICKLSAGWRPHFVGYGTKDCHNFYFKDEFIRINHIADWKYWTERYPIYDEYDNLITFKAFWKTIESRQRDKRNTRTHFTELDQGRSYTSESWDRAHYLDSEGYWFTEWEFS